MLKHQHIIEYLHHLTATNRTAMRHIGAHRLQDRPDMNKGLLGCADHDAEFAARSGLARAGDRRIRILDAFGDQPRFRFAG